MSSSYTVQDEMMRRGLTFVAAAVVPPDVSYLEEKINELYGLVKSQAVEIESLRKQIIDLKEAISPVQEVAEPSQKVIEAVASYLKRKKEAYPSEIADVLGISVREIMAAISVLQKMNKVEEI